MRYQHVCVEALSYTLAPHIVTSEEVENRLGPIYERFGLNVGRLELMTGIRERRFFDVGTTPGQISAITANQAIDASRLDRRHFGALIHGSVCRDQMEPATASSVHHAAGLPQGSLILDVSNACLGLLNGMVLIADMIELGRIRAGVVVGTEVGRSLVDATIDMLLADDTLTRQQLKRAFASLTIGSGSAAIVLCDRSLSQKGHRLLGGAFRADTESHLLCQGGVSSPGDSRPLMSTDAEALLHAGMELAARTWPLLLRSVDWEPDEVTRVITHQVGRAHRKLLLERLDLAGERDFPTYSFLGNTGAVALPVSLALAAEQGHVAPGARVALLGIGSGLNSLMLGLEWGASGST